MLSLTSVTRKFSTFSLCGISFTIDAGDYFILLGESGAGKSMVLETNAGLTLPESGTIILDGRDITRERIQNRGTGLVFQDHAVFPHMTVAENIGYSLHGSNLSHAAKSDRIAEIAQELGISGLLERRPSTLSGGELQRVALGRTLIQDPKILLLDEPLSSLDTKLKSDLRRLLRKLHAGGQTILHVTHDYEEALSLATKIAVIREGQIIQTGTPAEVFSHPKSEFVASFIGIRNFFNAKLFTENMATFARVNESTAIRISESGGISEGFVMIRGEDIILSNEPVETSAANNFPGVIAEIIPTRGGLDVVVSAGIDFHALITSESMEALDLYAEKHCWVHFKATAVKMVG